MLLLERGLDINTTGKGGQTALHVASVCGHASFMAVLLERGADVEVKDWHGSTPLHVASYNGHVPALTLLIEHGADVSSTNANDGSTGLLRAALRGHATVVSLLLEHGADCIAIDDSGLTAMHFAAQQENEAVITLLRSTAQTSTQKTSMAKLRFIRPHSTAVHVL